MSSRRLYGVIPPVSISGSLPAVIRCGDPHAQVGWRHDDRFSTDSNGGVDWWGMRVEALIFHLELPPFFPRARRNI